MGKEKVENAFDEDGLLDDKCAACSRRCCCAPPPCRVAIVPVILLLAIFSALFAILYLDATGLCTASGLQPLTACVNGTDVVINGVTTHQPCPTPPRACDYVAVAGVSVQSWSLFFIIIIAGYALLRAAISIVWWIIRACSGKFGLIWAFVKPNDIFVHLLLWNLLFYISFNIFLFYATPIVYQVCNILSTVITIIAIIAIVANVLATMAARYLSKSARKRLNKFRTKAKLVDKVLKNDKKSIANMLTFGASDIVKKTAKNAKATAEAAKDGDDVVVELKESKPEVTDEVLKETFVKIAGSKGYTNKAELAKWADVSGGAAKDAWAMFSSEPEGTIYLNEFIFGVRNVERGLRDVLNELKNRQFLADIIHSFILIIGAMFGVVIGAEAIGLELGTILTSLSIFGVGLGMMISGAFGQVLTSFFFLLTTKAYYVGDVITIGGDTMVVKKITLMNTFGVQADGIYAILNNAAISQARIVNRTRSGDCTFVFDAAISPSTSQAQIDQWKAAIQGYIDSKPEDWRSPIGFNITGVDSIDNKMVITMAASIRGANWSRGDLFLPKRSELFNFIRKAAAQIGISYSRSVQPTTTVTLPAPQAETEPADLNLGVKKTVAGKIADDDESSSEDEEKKKEREKKLKKKKSKKSE